MKHFQTTLIIMILLSSTPIHAGYNVEKRVYNGVKYELWNWNYGQELSAYIIGFTSTIPENLTIPTEVNLLEGTAYDGTYPVLSINNNAFEGCTKLRTVTISNVNAISENAFKDCTNLTSVYWESWWGGDCPGLGDNAFNGCIKLTAVSLPQELIYLPYAAFKDCISLKEFNLPNSVRSISSEAFSGCTSLEQIIFPSSVTDIDDRAFYNCNNLTEISIPSTLERLNGRCFEDCSSLKSVVIEDGSGYLKVGTFGSYDQWPAFVGCSIEHLYLGRQISSSEAEGSFGNIKSLEIGQSVQSIGDIFRDFKNLTSVKLPESFQEIGYCAFIGCSSLTTINIPNSVTYIGDNAFNGCTALPSITIGNGVNIIKYCAFQDCTNLTNVIIGRGINTIESRVFYNCAKLKDVYCFAEEVPNTITNAFENSPIVSATLYVPAGSVDLYRITPPWSGFSNILPLTEIGGDLNNDSKVDIADAVSILNLMAEGDNNPLADMNGDNKVDIADFVTILNIMAQQ